MIKRLRSEIIKIRLFYYTLFINDYKRTCNLHILLKREILAMNSIKCIKNMKLEKYKLKVNLNLAKNCSQQYSFFYYILSINLLEISYILFYYVIYKPTDFIICLVFIKVFRGIKTW